MFGGATTGTNTATSGAIYVAPTPDKNYKYIIHYNAMPTGLETNTGGTYVSNYFPQGLLYACLVEAFMFLKGPTDMLTLYENCLLYTSPSPRDRQKSRMPSSA